MVQGAGVRATAECEGSVYDVVIGNATLHGERPVPMEAFAQGWEARGCTVVYVSLNGALTALRATRLDNLLYAGAFTAPGVGLPMCLISAENVVKELRGDTSGGGGKPATLETGAVVRVPLFVGQEEIIKVDTRSGEYVSRVK